MKLAEGIIAGEDVVLKKKEQLKVDTDTDGTECKDADADKVALAPQEGPIARAI